MSWPPRTFCYGGLFNAALRRDPAGILEKQGPNTRHPDVIRISDTSKVAALESDAELAGSFHNLTPGRRKSHVIYLGSTKAPVTRVARIVKFRNRILAGRVVTES